jgi:hypothetical protein
MRYFFDTEFIDNGKTIELISIGIISQDGREYYAESSEFDPNNACPWVQENVIKYLDGHAKPRSQIRDEIVAFIGEDIPIFYAYYGAYDWVIFCQLFGRMMDIPAHWPHLQLDVKQLSIHMGNLPMPIQTTRQHNALNDAAWTKDCFDWLLLSMQQSKVN